MIFNPMHLYLCIFYVFCFMMHTFDFIYENMTRLLDNHFQPNIVFVISKDKNFKIFKIITSMQSYFQ